jgi:DNA-binding XRE family transcriptional regulator
LFFVPLLNKGVFGRWTHALSLLASLGWQPVPSEGVSETQPVFYTQPYPEWLDPESGLKKPKGWVDLWLEHKLMIKPPHPIPERMNSLIHPKKVLTKTIKPAVQEPLTGAEVKMARKDKKWTQAKLAGTLGIHQSMIAKIESGDRPISSDLEADIRRLLEL